MSKTYGYARVSSKEQHLDRQILRLQEYVEKDQIIVDKQSGATLERPGYQALKGQLGLRAVLKGHFIVGQNQRVLTNPIKCSISLERGIENANLCASTL